MNDIYAILENWLDVVWEYYCRRNIMYWIFAVKWYVPFLCWRRTESSTCGYLV